MDLNLTDLSEYWLSMEYNYRAFIVGGFLFCVAIAYFALLKTGVKKMVTPGQKRLSVQQREVIEDALTFAIEEAVYKGKMSRKSARFWYDRLAIDYQLHGLKPVRRFTKKLHVFKAEKLKEEIKARLANGMYSHASRLPGDLSPPWEPNSNSGRTSTQDKFRAKFKIA